jgi:hypothetical protein
VSRGSSGSIVSDYGLDDRANEVRSPTGADFSSSLCIQTGSGAHPASYPMGTGGSFPGGKARPRRDADHSPTHPHLVPRLRMSRSYTSSPPCACMACSGTALLFTNENWTRSTIPVVVPNIYYPNPFNNFRNETRGLSLSVMGVLYMHFMQGTHKQQMDFEVSQSIMLSFTSCAVCFSLCCNYLLTTRWNIEYYIRRKNVI